MLSEGWLGVVKHEFQLEGMNLTNVLYADWEPYTEGLRTIPDALIRTSKPRWWIRWMGFKTRGQVYSRDVGKKYVVKLEIDHTSVLDLEVPDDIIKHKSTEKYSNLFFNIEEEVINRLGGDQQIEVLWNHIKLELKEVFPEIHAEREKHLKDIRKSTHVRSKEEPSPSSPASHEKNSEVE